MNDTIPFTAPSGKHVEMNAKEHNLQKAVVQYIRVQYPHVLFFAIPNGGQRNAVVGAKLKAEGALKGVPDLFIAAIGLQFVKSQVSEDFDHHEKLYGLFIELKIRPNKPTPEQVSFMDKATAEGYKCAVCYSFDEAKELIDAYLK